MKTAPSRDGAAINADFRLRPVTRAVLGFFLAGVAVPGQALPTGAEISAGSGVVHRSGGALTIQQTTLRLAINWQSFGIGAQESVVFRQPDANAIALNRVLGQDPSVILGSLSANGQVFVLNPNGVLFGPGSRVDVGGIVASTLGLSDADFLAGRHTFTNAGGAGSVVNRGAIRAAEGGYVALLGPQVVNEGLIAARLGTVALGAGDQVTLTLAGNSLVGFAVDQAAVAALVANRQLIQADGGAVVLSARAKDALLATVVNNEGIVEARSVSVRNGVIRLEGGASGVVAVGGGLDASGVTAGESGGSVTITGDKVALVDGALVDASGHAGGGTVLVGGDYQGRNPEVRNASRSYVGPDAIVRADATHNGEGGRVIVWADEAAQFYGTISARGGPGGGNGGFVETSGKVTLQSTGTVDASAASGHAGQWLLDPNNITIQTAGVNTNVTAGPNFTTTNDSAIVTTGSIVAALNAGTSVTVTTGSAGANTQPGNITVANAIAKTAGGNAALTLTAVNNIVFNAGANVSSTSNQLNLTLNAGGAITSPVAINTNGGVLTFNAAGASTQSGVVSGAGSIVKSGAGTLTLSGANSYSGATSINAGALQLGAANRIANTSAVTVASGATFNLNNFAETVGSIAGAGNITLGTGTLTAGGNNTSTAFSGVATGSGGLTKTGTGTLTLSGANAYGGTTRINAGTLRAAGGSAIPDASPVTLVNAAGATLDLAASEIVGNLSGGGATGGNVVLGSNTLTVNQAGTTTYAGVIGGTGGLTKIGAGALTLSRANTYIGATTVGAGTLALGASHVLADSSHLVVDGGTFSMTSRSDTVAGVQLRSGSITGTTGVLTATSAYDMQSGTVSARLAGTVGLDKTSPGTVTLTGTNAYTGTTTISDGRLTLGGNAILNTGVVDLQVGVLQVNATEQIGRVIAAPGTTLRLHGSLRFGDAVDTVIASRIEGGGGLAKQGTSAVTLTGDNAYTGATTVDAGRLRVERSTALGAGTGAGLGTTVAAGAALEMSGDGLLIDEPLALSGSGVGNNGALRNLGGDNVWSGTLTLQGTTELQSDAGTLTLGAANAVTGTNRSLTFDGAGNGVIDGTITTGSGTLTKNGAGTLTLAGTNTYTGVTTVSAGALQVANGNGLGATAAGTSIGSDARLIVDGVALGAEPITLNGPGLLGAGAITSNGVASLAGPITLAADSVIAPNAGSTLTLAGPVDGAFGLTTDGTGTLVLNGTVGGITPLAYLTTGATGTTGIDTGLVRTSGDQTYNNATAIGAGVTLRSTGGNLTAAGPITATAGALSLLAAGNVDFANAANDFDTVGVTAGGNATLRDANALALGASTVGTLTATAGGGLTLDGTVTATGGGSSIVLAGSTFTNHAGATALDPGAGRWLVYSTDPATNVFGGLASGNQALWDRTHPTAVTETGNRYVFAVQPTLTFTSTDVAKIYGQDATAAVASAFAVTGFVDAAAYGGVFTQDTAANTYSGAPVVASAGVPATAPVAGSPYPITVDVSGVATTTGYGKTDVSAGLFTIAPRPLAIAADPQTKVYGQPDPALTYAIGGAGLVSGDVLAGALTRVSGETVAGGPYAILQGTLTNAANPNYAIAYTGNVLSITPATLTYLAHPASVVQGTPFPPFTGTVLGFQWTDTQASSTTGTLAFATTAASNSPAGTYPIDGFGLVANFGNYVFAQAPSNATALTIEPRGSPVPPVELPQAYTGALATAAQSESTCAELQADGQAETLCGAQQNFRLSEQVNLVPGWRRVIEVGPAALTVEGEGMHTP